MRLRGNNLRVGSSSLIGRRFMPPRTAVPIVMGEEPWRERPHLRAMNPFPRVFWGRSRHGSRWPSRCHFGGRCRAHLSVQNAAQIVGRIEGRIAGYLVVSKRSTDGVLTSAAAEN